MAYSQLARAHTLNIRVFAVNLGMPTLKAADRQSNVRVFINATIMPIVSEGWEERVEFCFSEPGIGVRVRRWKAVTVQTPGNPDERFDGIDAWIIQHEGDHQDGILCTARALGLWRPLYSVPQELTSHFVANPRAWRDYYPFDQWLARRTGEFDLATYKRYL